MSEEAVVESGEVDNSQAVADMIERPENVPEKFWNQDTKTTNNDAVLESYNQLSSKFGAFTGAPEAYEFTLGEELVSKGANLDDESPLLTQFREMAKESNMSQEMANQYVNMFVEDQFAGAALAEEGEAARVTGEMEKLGDNAQQRVSNIENWAQANLNEEQRNGLIEMATTAGAVQAIEGLIAKSRNAPMQTQDINGAGQVDMAEIQKLQFAKDDNGNRKMHTDPTYRKMVQDKFAQALPGENIQTVG
jgi:hypothetical protein